MKFLIFLVLSFFILTGCGKVREGSKEVGRPIGKTLDALSGVSEGALEGYSETKREQPNPYDR